MVRKEGIALEKVIFLVDMNAFFISCEMTRNPSLIGKPAAVAGDPSKRTGIVLAANYEARNFGVKTAMVLHQALKLCPEMVLLPPDHSFYQQKSTEVMNLLSNYTPVIEQNSIDEAWLDMTGTEGLFGPPIEAAKLIMDDIKNTLGLWCSIGISNNKFLAKMASEMKKPLGVTELYKDDVSKKLWTLPVKSMYGVGSKTAEKLNQIGIKTIEQLAKSDVNHLVKLFGKTAIDLCNQARGVDLSPIKVNIQGDMKSIGRSTTLPRDVLNLDEIKSILMELCEDIGMTARKNNKTGRTLNITIKYSDFQVITRQATITATCYTKDIFENAYLLFKKNWNSIRPVRLVGISLSGFDDDWQSEQMSLFTTPVNTKHQEIDRVMDMIRSKHGTQKISRALFLSNQADKSKK